MALGLNDNPKDLSRMEQFMASRRFLDEQPRLDGFFKAHTQGPQVQYASLNVQTLSDGPTPYEEKVRAYKNGKGDFDETANPDGVERERRKSGYYVAGAGRTSDDDEKRDAAKRNEEKTQQAVGRFVQETINQSVLNISRQYSSSVSDQEAAELRAQLEEFDKRMGEKYDEIGTTVTVNVNGQDVERKQVVIDGKTYTVNQIGYVFDESGKMLDEQQEKELFQSGDPDAQKIEELVEIRDERQGSSHEIQTKLHTHAEAKGMEAYDAYITDVGARKQDLVTATEKVDQYKTAHPDMQTEFTVDGQKVTLNDKAQFVAEDGKVISGDDVYKTMDAAKAAEVQEYRDLLIEQKSAAAGVNSSEKEVAARVDASLKEGIEVGGKKITMNEKGEFVAEDGSVVPADTVLSQLGPQDAEKISAARDRALEKNGDEAISTAPRTVSATGTTGLTGEDAKPKASIRGEYNAKAEGATTTPDITADNTMDQSAQMTARSNQITQQKLGFGGGGIGSA